MNRELLDAINELLIAVDSVEATIEEEVAEKLAGRKFRAMRVVAMFESQDISQRAKLVKQLLEGRQNA